jgi:serine/threonine-protein kinase
MLTGARPFAGAASNVMHQIIHEDPVAPSVRKPDLHPAFDAVLRKAMAKRMEDRYPTAHAFLQALTEAHLQHTGGLPLTEEDNERTVLAFRRPAPAAEPARAASPSPQGTAPAPGSTQGSNLTASAPEWLLAVAPALQVALSTQIGPVAKLVLKNTAREALDLDDLCARLLTHIGSDAGRAQFQDEVREIKKKHGLSTLGTMGARSQNRTGASVSETQLTQMTGMPTLLQLSPELMEAAQQKLAVYVGPIAKILAKRASKMTGNADEFYRLLADNLPDQLDRARFLRDVSGKT